ncbi:MAG: EAL domain-containing protein [Timaviella obliquedivisa GSE-PSE-MK23-08B]|nr:EAL domain-containing protein [Timaviella obliquedivisa GSE-PSE-MK23-08B]
MASSPELIGYQVLDKIYDGSRTLVYRAIRVTDDTKVVVKLLKNVYPNSSELIHFRNQYNLTQSLKSPGIIQSYCLEHCQNGFALVMEDFGGISLADYAKSTPLPLRQFFPIALQIVQTLEVLCQERLIHKDIKPQNILINPHTLEVKLTDFSIASLLPKEVQELHTVNVLEGTLAYMSPEQTGRMNRGIDYRTDFYSLGVTFYELLTGRLPFRSQDPLELVHAHISQHPPSPTQIIPTLPLAISHLIFKLMAKAAEDRYQTCQELQADLEHCRQQWETLGDIPIFKLGRQDCYDRFAMPKKLYGRENEVKMLLSTFEEILLGSSQLVLVSGAAGVGKTAVVQEIHKPVVQRRGYFIQGKFDQCKRNVPFLGIVQALRQLMTQLLTESEEVVQAWRSQLVAMLGEKGRMLTQVLPELEQIIGVQPMMPELLPDAAQKQFNLLFNQFIRVFTSGDRPLVIFLDDLQWADPASLNLLKHLVCDVATHKLLLIGAYQDEVEAQNLSSFISEINHDINRTGSVSSVYLAPLTQSDITDLIADLLSCSQERVQPLAKLVYQKARGNPFLSRHLLKSFHQDGLIYYRDGWECDISQIQTLTVTDDVVELMISQLCELAAPTQQVLQLAACMGDRFNLKTLAIVYKKSEAETAVDLSQAVQEGFVLPQNASYRFQPLMSSPDLAPAAPATAYQFLDDRIQQTAYALISGEHQRLTHLEIGRLLLQNIPSTDWEEYLFEIVNSLNQGTSLMAEDEQANLASLNLRAGQKAKAATAYTEAMEYLTTGISLLTSDSWQADYCLTLALYKEGIEAAFLKGQWDELEQWSATALSHGKTQLDTIRIYEIKMLVLIGQNRLLDAIALGLSILKTLGIEFPQNPQPEQVAAELSQMLARFADRSISDLANLPVMTNPNALAAMDILCQLSTAAFKATPNLSTLVVLKQVELSIEHGNTGVSGLGYAGYGLILCTVQGDIESGYQFGQLAITLVSTLNSPELKGKVLLTVNNFIRPWKEPVQTTLPALREAHSSALEAGDLEFAAYSGLVYSFHAYLTGKELVGVAQDMATYGQMMKQTHQNQALFLHIPYWQAVLSWLGRATGPCCLTGETGEDSDLLTLSLAANNREAVFYFYLNKMVLCYGFADYEQAAIMADAAEPYIAGSLPVVIFYFYDSLIKLAVRTPETEQEILERVAANQDKLRRWADYAPTNHLHKWELVEAERCRVLGQVLEAIDGYDRAIARAQEHQYPQEAALANELAARFYLLRNQPKIAQAYLFDAYYGYARWGATAKVKQLEQQYALLLVPILQRVPENIPASLHQSVQRTVTSTSSGVSAALDLATILKATQAISGEMELDQLLRLLMHIVAENAGAERGVLLLKQQEQWHAVVTYLEGLAHRLPDIALEQIDVLPQTVMQWVKRTQKPVIVKHSDGDMTFAADPYLMQQQPKSFLALPIFKQGSITAILYLENRTLADAFTSDRLEVLKLICAQAAISIESAKLYRDAQNYAHQLECSQEKLIFDALHDSLTGLPNRHWFIQKLAGVIEQMTDDPSFQYAVLFLDLDLFKVVNDSLGHLVGDQLLKQVAERVQTCLCHDNAIARFGGDEFAILLENISNANAPVALARLIETQLMEPFEINNHEMVVSASIGITLSSIGYQNPEEILRDVDTALYRAKAQGRGCYALFDPTMQTSAVERLQLENDLRRAIEALSRKSHSGQTELQLNYQPIISLVTGYLSGFEALVRWQHPKQGWISPVKFIPVAEETGLIHALGWWVLRTACHQLSQWQRQFPHAESLVMNVNISTLQLRQHDLVEQIQALLTTTQIPPTSLKLEITESSILQTFSSQAAQLKELKDLGIRLCIDDFGTGYSSLSRLHEFPVDTLKIDRAFVNRIDGNAGGAEIVQTIIGLAASLGMDAVAEGVETFVQLERLRALHCELGQGFFFSKPIDAQAAAKLVQQAKTISWIQPTPQG